LPRHRVNVVTRYDKPFARGAQRVGKGAVRERYLPRERASVVANAPCRRTPLGGARYAAHASRPVHASRHACVAPVRWWVGLWSFTSRPAPSNKAHAFKRPCSRAFETESLRTGNRRKWRPSASVVSTQMLNRLCIRAHVSAKCEPPAGNGGRASNQTMAGT